MLTHPVLEDGKKVGHLQAICTATKTSKSFIAASFQCLGTYVLKGGTLVVSTTFTEGTNEGPIIGGTGTYAEAVGTFSVLAPPPPFLGVVAGHADGIQGFEVISNRF